MMRARVASSRSVAQCGVALIAVLWIVAALSIIVTGVVYAVRGELRMVSAARQSVQAVALGEAAIALALQEMRLNTQRPPGQFRVEAPFAGLRIPVDVMPLTGLVDISTAQPPLLQGLYQIVGGLPANQAEALAVATVEARNARDSRGRALGFEAVQDLLRVPGMGYDLYARLAPLLTVDSQGDGKVNPLAAPPEVLTLLAGGNPQRAAAVLSARASGGLPDTTTLQADWVSNTTTSRYRVQALVPMGDGTTVVVSRGVDLRADSRLGLPWRFFYAEHWTVAPDARRP